MEIVKSYMNHFSDPPKTVHNINNRLLGTLTANLAQKCIYTNIDFQTLTDTAVAQLVRAFALQLEVWVFASQHDRPKL